jgi:hypothetical protein
MGDPELRNDEKILLRTPGVFVKSIPFEGILTNKRIILVDRATNLLPQKEIPLVTIRDVEAGENAIRDQVITLSVLLRSGEKRQMILTFSRQTGGNRIRERDAWLKALKEHTSSGFEQVVQKVIPARGQPPKKPETSSSPRIRVIGSPHAQNAPLSGKLPEKKERQGVEPVKKIIEVPPAQASPEPRKNASFTSSPQLGTYCSRCGNRVPDGSGYCNRCGSRIFVPNNGGALLVVKPQPHAEENSQPAVPEDGPGEPRIEQSAERIPSGTLRSVDNEPFNPAEREPAPRLTVTREELSGRDEEITEPDVPFIPDSPTDEPVSAAGDPGGPKKPWHGFSVKPGKKAVIGIVLVIIVIAVILGGFFIYPMISERPGTTPDTGAPSTTLPTIVKTMVTPKPMQSMVPSVMTTRTIVPGNRPANVGF